MKIELHVHTRFSKDSLLCFYPLYLKCRILNIKCIAITEHNNIEGGIEFQKFCSRYGNKIDVIVGEEVFSRDGEIIGLFLTEKIEEGLSATETMNEIKKQNGIVYVPHPYDEKRCKTVLKEDEIEKNKHLIDFVEIHNGRNISQMYGEKQLEIAEKYQLKQLIGSDAHTIIEIGRNYMDVSCNKSPKNADEFIDCISKASFHKMKCIKYAHKITIVSKLCKMAKEGNYYEIYKSVTRRFRERK